MLYFLPKSQAAAASNLDQAGLASLRRRDDRTPQFTDLAGAGPGDQFGQLVTWDEAPLYLPDAQTWYQARGAAYWYGWTEPPTPASVARLRLVEGVTVILGDGQPWTLPAARNLPCRIDLDDAGRPKRIPTEISKPFVDLAAEALQAAIDFARNQTPGWTWEQQFEFLCAALAVNYRITRDVVARLGLLEDDNLFFLIAHVTDVAEIGRVIEETEKKRLAAVRSGSPPSGSPADSSPSATSPP